MATDQHHHSSHGDDGAGPLNHETTDISLDGVGKLTIGFVVILVVVSSVIYGTYRMLDRQARAADTSISKINEGRGVVDVASQPLMDKANAMEGRGRQPAGPKLLTNEPQWLNEYRARQLTAATTYGWVDKDGGVVRLPIERAKQLLLERGLPVTAAPAEVVDPAADAVPAADGTAPAAPAPAAPGGN